MPVQKARVVTCQQPKKNPTRTPAKRKPTKKQLEALAKGRKVRAAKSKTSKSNPSDLPRLSFKSRAKRGAKKAARKAGTAAAEGTKRAAVWTGKKIAKGGKRAGRKAWGTTKASAKGAWQGAIKGWKENPTSSVPKEALHRAEKLEEKAMELWDQAQSSGEHTAEGKHYAREAEKLMREAQDLLYPYNVNSDSLRRKGNPVSKQQRARMSKSLFAIPAMRKYRLDSPARNKYSLTLLNKHYRDGARSKTDYVTAYVNIMVAFIKNGQPAKRRPLVKTPQTENAFKAASPLKNPAAPVSLATKKKAMQALAKTCKGWVKQDRMTAANCKSIEAQVKRLGSETAKENPTSLSQAKRQMLTKSLKFAVKHEGKVYLGKTAKGQDISVGPYRTATSTRPQYALIVGNVPHVMPFNEAVAQFVAMAKPQSIKPAPGSRERNPAKKPTCKRNPSSPKSGSWYYRMTYETWSPEAIDVGETDDKGWLVERSDTYDTLEELLSDVEGEASWVEWSGSPASPGDWIVSEGDIDYMTGDTTNKSLWIERTDGKPLTKAQMKKITQQLGLMGARLNPTCKRNPSSPKSGSWYYRMTYETWSPEDVEVGDTDDKGWLVERSDTYDTLEELLSDVEGEASWVEWSGSPASPGDWIVSEGDIDYMTGDTTNKSLRIERTDGKPLTKAQMKKITQQLGLMGARLNPTCKRNPSKDQLHVTTRQKTRGGKKITEYYVLHEQDWIRVRPDYGRALLKAGAVKVPWSHGKLPHHAPSATVDNKTLGLMLHNWHSSQSDPIYAAGSTLFAGHKTSTAMLARALDAIRSLKLRAKGADRKELATIEKNLEYRVGLRRSRGAAKANPSRKTKGKVPATSITITRTEGGNHDLGEPHTIEGGDVWNKANVLLSLWGREAAPSAHNKVKFHIRYADGETYSGTYYVSRQDQVAAQLGQHIRSTLRAASGKKRPSHMSEADYKQKVAKLSASQKAAYAKFLREYEIG